MADDAPAYRGISTIVFDDDGLTASSYEGMFDTAAVSAAAGGSQLSGVKTSEEAANIATAKAQVETYNTQEEGSSKHRLQSLPGREDCRDPRVWGGGLVNPLTGPPRRPPIRRKSYLPGMSISRLECSMPDSIDADAVR